MSINEEKFKMWCEQVDRRLARLEGEDYRPKEPLIKDEKIRKAVKAWAEACGIDEQKISYDGDARFWCMNKDCAIDFYDVYGEEKEDDSLLNCKENDRYYTIAELCGEEEE